MSSLGELLDRITGNPRQEELVALGKELGRLYTDHGLPLDLSLHHLGLPRSDNVLMLYGACQWFIDHKRRSGALQPAINRQRAVNRKMLEDFTRTGETGIY